MELHAYAQKIAQPSLNKNKVIEQEQSGKKKCQMWLLDVASIDQISLYLMKEGIKIATT